MAEPTPLRFGDLNVPGHVLRGFQPFDAELRKVAFHPPGTNGTLVKTLGLLPRPIVVPMVVHSPTFRTYRNVQDFLLRLTAFKGQGRQVTLSVPLVDGPMQFEKCWFEGFVLTNPQDGILQDLSGSLGDDSNSLRWFVDLTLTFMQAQAGR